SLMASSIGEASLKLYLPPTHVYGAQSEPDAQSPGKDALGASTERAAPPSAPGLQSFGSSARQEANGAPIAPQISGDGGVFINRALRERVEADTAAFLAA